MDENTKKEIQSATLERLMGHLKERKDVQNIDLMNLAGFCRNCLSRWYREEAEKKGIEISDPDARNHIYGMPYPEWKEKYLKPQLDFMLNNLEDMHVRGKENMGFFKWEADKFQRLYDIIDQEQQDEWTVTNNRKDFITFVNEHDKRRGTDFLKTFPEMEKEYHQWSNL